MSDHSLVPTLPSEADHNSPASLFDARRQATFCENLSHHGNVRLACRAAGISPQTAYRARRASRDFGACWDAALVLARDHVEEVLADRALNGVEEVVYYHGEEIGRRIRYDNRLLLAHLVRLDRLAERMEERGPVHFDDGLEALEHGRPVAGEGGALTPREEAGAKDRSSPDRRFAAMEAARPADAPPLDTLGPWGEVEAVQLAAFEAGEPNWWLLTPHDAEDEDAAEPANVPEEPLSEWERRRPSGILFQDCVPPVPAPRNLRYSPLAGRRGRDGASAAHIHRAKAGATGPVVVTLAIPKDAGEICVKLEKSLL